MFVVFQALALPGLLLLQVRCSHSTVGRFCKLVQLSLTETSVHSASSYTDREAQPHILQVETDDCSVFFTELGLVYHVQGRCVACRSARLLLCEQNFSTGTRNSMLTHTEDAPICNQIFLSCDSVGLLPSRTVFQAMIYWLRDPPTAILN